MNHIAAVGFEIEGGWKGEEGKSPFKDITLIRDDSINGQSIGNSNAIAADHIGEAVSPVIPFDDVKWRAWLEEHWPNADKENRTNRTCGFHIHISTINVRDYVMLTGKNFLYGLQKTLMTRGEKMKLHKKHVFWERMQGLNRFCSLDFDVTRQMKLKKGEQHGRPERYGFLNFAWDVYGTMEFRALPTFRDAHIAVGMSETFFNYVNQYLDEVQNVKVKHAAKLVA